MARIHGKNGTLQVSDTDVVFIKSWSLEISNALAESNTMQSDWVERLGGKLDASGSLSVDTDLTDTNGQEAFYDAVVSGNPIAFKGFPEGDETGKVFWGGNVLVGNQNLNVNAGELVGREFSFSNADSSGVTRQTVSA